MSSVLLLFTLGLLVKEPKKLTLDEVVTISSSDSKDVRIAEKSVEAADERTQATRALLFPSLSVEGNVLVWNKALVLTSTVPGVPDNVFREQVTAQVSLTVAQPLTGLYALFKAVELDALEREVAEADRDRTRLDATQRAVEAFLRALQARAVLEVSEKSITQVDQQLERARALETAGVLASVDALRIESTRASVLQNVLRARSNVAIADGALALALDWPQSTEIQPVDNLPDPPPKVELATPQVFARATQLRPELVAAQKRVEQASTGKSAAYAGFIPNISAIASYQHVEGQGPFAERDAVFGGATLSWTAFEWGRTKDQVDEAAVRLEQAELSADFTRQQIEFDVTRRTLDATTAYETLSVATSGLRAAEEAYRIQSARFGQGAATTTDLLDAETDVARSRTEYASARYEYYVALALLARSIGKVPSATPATLID